MQMFDVAFFAADMLFAGLQRQAVGPVPPRIDRHADKPAGHRALVGVLDGHIGGVRATIADGNAEALRAADRDIGTHFARRLQERQRQRIGGDGWRLHRSGAAARSGR